MDQSDIQPDERIAAEGQVCRPIIAKAPGASLSESQAHVLSDGRINITLKSASEKTHFLAELFRSSKKSIVSASIDRSAPGVPPPSLSIVVQVVGSRGDVQPFIALSLGLKNAGHRVRVATHLSFKQFVESNGLEFFNIGGDPERLMAYMVKNPGLLPSLQSIRHGDISENRSDMTEIMEGCWRSCFETINADRGGCSASSKKDKPKPFLANAIIANPPSFAHVHCAEKLGIPLHLMFTMPWSPTQAFPHPLANINSSPFETSLTNYLSYVLADMLTWEGLGRVINTFRRKTLGLKPLSRSTGPTLVSRLRIPYTYCWSPSLIPKPEDWPAYISIAGFYFLPTTTPYAPPSELAAFLKEGPQPIYIGFGSIIVEEPEALTQIVIEAVRLAGVRAIISHGWSNLGSSAIPSYPDICFIGNCPHDWIFKKVSCVVHHGGAGTTAATMQAGKPSVIIPFFGDQPFWGQVVERAGAGPRPIPFKLLTPSRLATAIQKALTQKVLQRAELLSETIRHENGVHTGVSSFHTQLLQSRLSCSVSPNHAANWKVRKTDIRLSSCAAAMLMDKGLLDSGNIELLRPCNYDLNIGPRDPVSGLAFAIVDSATELAGDLEDFTSSLKDAFKKKSSSLSLRDRKNLFATCLRSIAQSSTVFIKLPVHIGVAVTQGLHNAPRIWGDENVRPQPVVDGFPSGIKAAYEEFIFGTFDGISSFVIRPFEQPRSKSYQGIALTLGTGALSGIAKTLSGLVAIGSYPLQGVETEIIEHFSTVLSPEYENLLLQQGLSDAALLSDSETGNILEQWQSMTSHVKKRRLTKH